MSSLADDIAALKAQINAAIPTSKVEYGYGANKRVVVYRSIDEMRRELARMEAEFTGRDRIRTTYAEHHR